MIVGSSRSSGLGDGEGFAASSAARSIGSTKFFVRPVILEGFTSRRMAQFAQCLGLNLPDAFARNAQLLSDFLERPLMAVLQAEAQNQYLPLALGKILQDILHLLFEKHYRCGLGRRDRFLIFDEVAQVRVFLFPNRRLERDRFLGDLHDLTHLFGRERHRFGDLFDRGLAAELLQELPGNLDQAVDRLDHVHGDANRSCLVGQRACDRLANPPRGVRREFVTLAVVELFDRTDQAEVTLLNEVQKQHPATDVLLRDRNHEPQVRFGQLAFRLFTGVEQLVIRLAVPARFELAGLNPHRQRFLLLHREQRDAPDLLEIHANRVVKRQTIGDGLLDFLFALRLGLLVLLLVDELDPSAGELFKELVQLLGRDLLEHVERAIDLFVGQRPLGLTARDELLFQLFQCRGRGGLRYRCPALFTWHFFLFHLPSLLLRFWQRSLAF